MLTQQVWSHERPVRRERQATPPRRELEAFMRVTFCIHYGVHEKGRTYDVPDWLGRELVSSGKAVEEHRRGTDAPAAVFATKVIHPSQVKRS